MTKNIALCGGICSCSVSATFNYSQEFNSFDVKLLANRHSKLVSSPADIYPK